MVDLKAFRKANNLTQQAVADYLGIKKAFVCQIETGRHSLPSKHLDRLLNNTEGWDTILLRDNDTKFGTNIETYTDTPTDEAVVITSQVIEEMTASRQLAEQALAMVQEQLEAKQQTILAVREQLATTQEQLTTSQEQLTTEQKQTTIAQQHLTVEQQQTNAALEEARMTREAMDRRLAESNQHITELIMMLKKNETRIERELALQEQQMHHHKEHHKEEHDHAHHPHKHSGNNDA